MNGKMNNNIPKGPGPDASVLERFGECADCTCFNLRKAARAVTQLFDEAMRPLGLRGTQFTMLVIARMNSDVPVTVMAEKMVMDRTTLTRNLRPLERMGLVETVRGEDRRTRLVRLTPKGNGVLGDALPLWRSAQARVVASIGPGRWAEMMPELARVVEVSRAA